MKREKLAELLRYRTDILLSSNKLFSFSYDILNKFLLIS